VNKQEFSATSWRSNQGYTKMHSQTTIKKNQQQQMLLLLVFIITILIVIVADKTC